MLKKLFIRVFLMAFLCFTLLFTGVFAAFNTFMQDSHPNSEVPVVRDREDEEFDDQEGEPFERDQLRRLVNKSNRVNAVLLGLDGGRSDTMMFISFDPDETQMDIISIPRDTYYPRKGYDGLGQKKINAAYSAHGAEGIKSIVSDLLYDVPVHYYVTLTYQGAASVVDAIGGVPMHIPQRMYYKDPYDSPPLVIDFAPGNHVLKGQDAVKFLRYRQPAPGSGAMDRNGDLGRVEVQQEFMKSAMKQAMSLGNLPTLASSAFRFVRTDVELQDLVRYANQARNMNPDTMRTFTLPGEARTQNRLSYFFHHGLETRQLLIHIYSNGEVPADLEEARRLEEEANGTADEEEAETETDSSNS